MFTVKIWMKREKELFVDLELECFRECLMWLQNLHRDNKTNSKILGKAVTALTLIRLSLQNVGCLTEAGCTSDWRHDTTVALRPMKEKLQEIPKP